MFLINDDNYQQFMPEQQGFMRGFVPRDLARSPLGSGVGAVRFDEDENMPLIPRQEWPERCAEMVAKQTRLSDIDNFPALDQGRQGFCWAYSSVGCTMSLRQVMGLPRARLSPHAVACKIYGFQDRGAWGAVSLEWIGENGCPDEQHWPQQSMSRSHDRPETWENAKLHRITEGYLDLDVSHPADAEMSFDQYATCWLNRIPTVCDHMWWGHSVYGMDLVDHKPNLGQQGLMDPNRWGYRGKNSWGTVWGDRGLFVFQGRKGIPDGGCAPRVVLAA